MFNSDGSQLSEKGRRRDLSTNQYPEAADTTRPDGGNSIYNKDNLGSVNIYQMSVRPPMHHI